MHRGDGTPKDETTIEDCVGSGTCGRRLGCIHLALDVIDIGLSGSIGVLKYKFWKGRQAGTGSANLIGNITYCAR